jgi:hypothetical protein
VSTHSAETTVAVATVGREREKEEVVKATIDLMSTAVAPTHSLTHTQSPRHSDTAPLLLQQQQQQQQQIQQQEKEEHLQAAMSHAYASGLVNAFKRYNLHDILPFLEQIGGVKKSSFYIIDHEKNPPLHLEGKSCVYVLLIHQHSDIFYVGQTNSIAQRLRQHELTYKPWEIDSVVFAAPNTNAVRPLVA